MFYERLEVWFDYTWNKFDRNSDYDSCSRVYLYVEIGGTVPLLSFSF